MADINLEDLLKGHQAQAGTEDNKALMEAPEAVAEKVTHQVETLTPEERKKVDDIKESINLMDSTLPLSYGSTAQKDIADFSDSILASVRTKDSGAVGELLNDLVTRVRGFEPAEEKGFLRKLPVIGALVNKTENLMEGYTKLSTQVDRIQSSLEKSKMSMLKDVAMFDGLYEKNLAYFKSLQLYIQAGEEKLQEMKTVTLPKLRQQAAHADPPDPEQ